MDIALILATLLFWVLMVWLVLGLDRLDPARASERSRKP